MPFIMDLITNYTSIIRYDFDSGVPASPNDEKRQILSTPIEKINVHVAGGNVLPLQLRGNGGKYSAIAL